MINTLGMPCGSEKAFGEGYNVLPVWKKRLDARTLVTTPNREDYIYGIPMVDNYWVQHSGFIDGNNPENKAIGNQLFNVTPIEPVK